MDKKGDDNIDIVVVVDAWLHGYSPPRKDSRHLAIHHLEQKSIDPSSQPIKRHKIKSVTSGWLLKINTPEKCLKMIEIRCFVT